MSNQTSPLRYEPISADDASRYGIEDADYRRMSQSLGRSPNVLEGTVLAYLWSDEVSARSGHTFLRSVYRRAPHVLGGRGSHWSVVDLGFQEQLVICSKSGTRLSLNEPREGATATFLAAYEEFRILGGIVPQGACLVLHVGESDQARSQHFVQLALSGVTMAANRCGVPILDTEFYALSGYELFPSFAIHLSGIRKEQTRPDSLTPPQLDGTEVLLYLGKDTAVIPKSRGGYASLPPASTAHSAYLADVVCHHLKDESLLAAQPVSRGGLITAVSQFASFLGCGLQLNYENIPFFKVDPRPEIGLLAVSPHRCLAVARTDRLREISESFARAGYRAEQIGAVSKEKTVVVEAQHRPAFAVPVALLTIDPGEQNYELLMYPPMLHKTAQSEGDESRSGPINKNRSPWEDVWLDFLANPNVSSRQRLMREVDRFAGSRSLLDGVFAGGLLRIDSESSFVGNRSYRALAHCSRSFPVTASEDPYLGSAYTAADALRTLAACGAHPVAATQSLFYGSPSQYKRLSEFSEGLRGLSDACRTWNIPIVTETVDFQSTQQGQPVPPTTVITMLGVHPDIRNRIGISFQEKGDRIFILGTASTLLAGSEYARYMLGSTKGNPPDINFQDEIAFAGLLTELAAQGLVRSAISIGAGGIAVALARAAFTKTRHFGATLQSETTSIEQLLFSEGPGRAIISFAPNVEEKVRELCSALGVAISGQGEIGGKDFVISGSDQSVTVATSSAAQIWNKALDYMMNAVA